MLVPSDGGTDPKPRIYRTYYPRLKQHFWRVSPMPRMRNITTVDRWRFAHRMAQEMNRGKPT